MRLEDSEDQETFDLQGTPDRVDTEEMEYTTRLLAAGLFYQQARISAMSAAH